ncbi:Aopep [Phodopus roborovskii]|uniref:Aopep protein n=1 Tax=Phodopus roborovskii TaxID=109678 RepID=A0AAU9ZM66_PHORO|nr:Aopep [Phodopus roborovskii]
MDLKLDPSRDDLPLMANTSHLLVKHYVLDLDVDFGSRIIEGTIVLFFGEGSSFEKRAGSTQEAFQVESEEDRTFRATEPRHVPETAASTFSPQMGCSECAACGKGDQDAFDNDGNHDNWEHASEISSSKYCCGAGNHGREDFLLVLDCCDLSVLKVEEVDVAAVPGLERFTKAPKLAASPEKLRHEIVRELVALPAEVWREQLECYTRCSQAPGCGELFFDTDNWSLQIRKPGAQAAADFPRAIRVWYKTKPEGQSVTWTSDQSGRPCVYTMGSPINNRALFPCQEPPVAMSTWQATVRAAAPSVVLMSGENSAKPTPLPEGTVLVYADPCSHVDYPCRFQDPSAATQDTIPHRVFAPLCLEGACREALLWLVPPCLSTAYSVLGTHPFSRLDILIVPANFPSLGMARYASQHGVHVFFLTAVSHFLCLGWKEVWGGDGGLVLLLDAQSARARMCWPTGRSVSFSFRVCMPKQANGKHSSLANSIQHSHMNKSRQIINRVKGFLKIQKSNFSEVRKTCFCNFLKHGNLFARSKALLCVLLGCFCHLLLQTPELTKVSFVLGSWVLYCLMTCWLEPQGLAAAVLKQTLPCSPLSAKGCAHSGSSLRSGSPWLRWENTLLPETKPLRFHKSRKPCVHSENPERERERETCYRYPSREAFKETSFPMDEQWLEFGHNQWMSVMNAGDAVASRKCEPASVVSSFEASRRLVLWNVNNSEAGVGGVSGVVS